MTKCSVKNCKNNSRSALKKDGISYFSFPRNETRCSEWTAIIAKNRGEEFYKPHKHSVVCSYHFSSSDIYTTTKGFKRLCKNAKPILHLNNTDSVNIEDPEIKVQKSIPLNTASFVSSHTSSNVNIDVNNEDHHCGESSIQQAVTNEDKNIKINVHEESSLQQDDLKSPSTSISIGSILDTPKKATMRKRINLFEKVIQNKNKQIDRLRKQNKRLAKKNTTLKEALSNLKKRKGIDESLFSNLSENLEVTNLFNALYQKNIKRRKRPFSKYPPAVRKFALTFHFYSPSAYMYVRRLCNTCLPHPNTLCNWYKNVNAKPGFTAESFDRLNEKAKISEKQFICALIADEMSIRQQKIWTGKHYEGLVDMGMGTNESEIIASQVYVIMLVAINDSFKIPLGYFFISSLTAEMKANLITIALRKCHQVNMKVVSLTFDGCKTNIAAMKILGCNLDSKASLTTYFKHPVADHNVVVFLDACHMIKLMRNVFESKKIIKVGENATIKWSYVTELQKLQQEEQLHLANKLTHRHIHFKNEIMKVKLATQLLSRSVAKAIEFCESNLKLTAFERSKPTTEFITILNNVFDILNTRNLHDHGYKKPLSITNADEILKLIDQAQTYLYSLKIVVRRKRTLKKRNESTVTYTTDNVPLWKSQSNTGVLGLIVCLESLKYLYKTMIETSVLSFFLTYKTSQDHIELFFGKIRSQGGYNNNPNTRQVKAAYKKLLTHLELSSKFSGNVIPLENIPILSGESAVSSLNATSLGYRKEIEDENAEIENMSDFNEVFINNCDVFSRQLDISDSKSDYIDQIVGYIAGNVVRQILRKIKCDVCISSLLAKHKLSFHSFIDIKNLGGLFYSSKDVFLLCKKTENTIRQFQNIKERLRSDKIIISVLKYYLNVNIFEELIQHSFESVNHRTTLMKTILQHYINIRFHYIAKKETEKIKNQSKRQLYNKLTLFQGN